MSLLPGILYQYSVFGLGYAGIHAKPTEPMPSVTLCASAACYRQLVAVADQLTARGFSVLLPETAENMRLSGDWDTGAVKTWLVNPEHYHEKKRLMDGHFAKVLEGDVTLVVNAPKNGVDGYVGGNVLMEMMLAYINKKPLFVLYPVSDACGLKEEVYGMQPVILDGDLFRLPGA